jgi:hypothetical protein
VIGGTPDDIPAITAIATPLDKFQASTHKSKMKFAVISEAAWLRYPPYPNNFGACGGHCTGLGSYGYFTQQITEIANRMLDPQYFRYNGRPLWGIYGSSNIDATHMNSAIATITSIVGAAPYVVDVNHNTTQAGVLGENAITTYGPNTNHLSAGQHPYTDQITQDRAFWPPAGFEMWAGVTALLDTRPRPSWAFGYADMPTMPEWINHLRGAATFVSSGFTNRAIIIYNWSEYMEGGPGINRTTQEGSRFLVGIACAKWGVNSSKCPSSITYEVDACNIGGAMAHTGVGWTCPASVGSHDYDENLDSTTNDTAVFTHVGTTAADVVCTKGPDRGQFSVKIDSGTPTTIDAYAASPAVHQTCWSSGALDGTKHAITVTVLGTKNGSSSSVQVGIDSFRVTADPRTF